MNRNKKFQQQVFETVARAMLKQNAKSANDYGSCCYRSPYGLKCAIGHLIDDRDYSLEMEGCFCFDIMARYELKNSPLLNETKIGSLNFYGYLQAIHDEKEVKDWKDSFIQFGKKYDLNVDFINDL